jgi:preprotein translocase subunit SecE
MIKNVGKFLSEVRGELSKVIWPTRHELIGSTIISLVFILFFAIYLGGVDFVFHNLARRIF